MRFDCTSFGISTVKLCWNSQFLGSSYWGIGERLSWSRCGGKSPSYLKPVKKPLLEFGYGYNPFLLIGCFSCNGIDVGHNAKHTYWGVLSNYFNSTIGWIIDYILSIFGFQVEHIIREEKMMAAQEIVELFCELISVRLPIIEAQRCALLVTFVLLSVIIGDRM